MNLIKRLRSDVTFVRFGSPPYLILRLFATSCSPSTASKISHIQLVETRVTMSTPDGPHEQRTERNAVEGTQKKASKRHHCHVINFSGMQKDSYFRA